MKYTRIVIVFSFVVFTSAIEQVKFKLAPQNLQNIKNAGDKCSTEYKVDPAVFPKIEDGSFERDETNNNYLYCIAQKLNLNEADGKVKVDKITSFAGDHPLLDKFKEAISKCNEAAKGSVIEVFMSIYQCYFETSPLLYEF